MHPLPSKLNSYCRKIGQCLFINPKHTCCTTQSGDYTPYLKPVSHQSTKNVQIFCYSALRLTNEASGHQGHELGVGMWWRETSKKLTKKSIKLLFRQAILPGELHTLKSKGKRLLCTLQYSIRQTTKKQNFQFPLKFSFGHAPLFVLIICANSQKLLLCEQRGRKIFFKKGGMVALLTINTNILASSKAEIGSAHPIPMADEV